MQISIVVPTYNEEKKIAKTLKTVLDFLKRKNYKFELVISDDGSQDKTRENVFFFQKDNKNIVFLENPHRGKGPTLISGFQKAKGDIVLFSDADLATPITEIPKLLEKIKKGYDVAIGSRGMIRQGAPIFRVMMALVFNLLVQALALPGVSDSQCGFKAFKKEALSAICAKMKLYSQAKEMKNSAVTAGFDVEALFVAKKLGLKIGQVPVFWHHVGTEGVNPLKDSIAAFLDVIKIRLNDLCGAYR
jgi:glycosyltransferase involved in cell wall biosynthesis